MIPLAGRDAQIYKFLVQIVAIGRHRRAWTRADVARVAAIQLGSPDLMRRRVELAERRATHAEQELARLRQGQPKPIPETDYDLPPRRTVELRRSEYEIFAEWIEGRSRHEIAQELDLSPATVSSCISLATAAIGAESAAQAAALVNRGVVLVKARTREAA